MTEQANPQDTVPVPRPLLDALREACCGAMDISPDDYVFHPERWVATRDAARAVVAAVEQAAEGEPRQGVIRHWWPDGRQYIAHADDGICDRCTPPPVSPSEDAEDAWCICNTGPNTDGPDETCSVHGRTYAEWIERGNLLQTRLDAADARIAELEAIAERNGVRWCACSRAARARDAANPACPLHGEPMVKQRDAARRSNERLNERLEEAWAERTALAAKVRAGLALADEWHERAYSGESIIDGTFNECEVELRAALSDPPVDAVTLPTTAEQAWEAYLDGDADDGYHDAEKPAFLAGFDAGSQA